MEGLDNSYIGAVVRPIGNFVGTVDAAIEVLGQVTCSIDFDPWKALLERSRDDLAACMHWSWILFSALEGHFLKDNMPSPPHEMRRVRFSFKAD